MYKFDKNHCIVPHEYDIITNSKFKMIKSIQTLKESGADMSDKLTLIMIKEIMKDYYSHFCSVKLL